MPAGHAFRKFINPRFAPSLMHASNVTMGNDSVWIMDCQGILSRYFLLWWLRRTWDYKTFKSCPRITRIFTNYKY